MVHEAGLVDRVRPLTAELIGLPYRLDELVHPPVDASPNRLRCPRVASGGRRSGYLGQLLEDGAPCGLGRMGGEDRLQHDPVDESDHFCSRYPRFDQRDEVLFQTSFRIGALHVQVLDAVDLLGDVGEVEVDGEGPYQLRGPFEVHIPEKLGELAGHVDMCRAQPS